MKRSKLIKNPWVISIIGVGLAVAGSCNPIDNKPQNSDDHPTASPKGWTAQDPHNAPSSISTEITPPANASIKRKSSFILSTDFLYWGVKQEQFTYASVFDSSSSKYNNLQTNRKWGPGFRVGLGGNLPYNNWDILLNWTHWNNPKTHTISKSSAVIVPDLLQTTEAVDTIHTTSYCQDVTSSWKASLNIFDLELGRFYSLSKKIKFRPHIGLELAHIHQNFSVEYSNFAQAIAADDYQTFKAINNFGGIGPRLGLNTRWVLGKYFGVYGNAAASLLCGSLHAKTRLIASDGTELILRNTNHSVKPVLQLAIGLDWAKGFAGKYFLRIGAGYENQVWWSQREVPTRASYDKTGNLTTEGLTANIRFEF